MGLSHYNGDVCFNAIGPYDMVYWFYRPIFERKIDFKRLRDDEIEFYGPKSEIAKLISLCKLGPKYVF